MFLFCVICFGLVLLVVRNLSRTATGRGFFAVRENEKAASTLGVHMTRYKLLAFAVSGGIAGLAGALFATNLGHAEANTWTTATSLLLVAMVMIGGLGSLWGGLLGAFLVIGLPRFLAFANPWFVSIGTGVLLILVLTRLRGGLAGLLQELRDRMVGGIAALDAEDAEPSARPQGATRRPVSA